MLMWANCIMLHLVHHWLSNKFDYVNPESCASSSSVPQKWESFIFWGQFICLFDPTAVSCKIPSAVLIVYPGRLRCRQPAGRWSHGDSVVNVCLCGTVGVCTLCVHKKRCIAGYQSMCYKERSARTGLSCAPATSYLSCIISLFHTMRRQHDSSLNPPCAAHHQVRQLASRRRLFPICTHPLSYLWLPNNNSS